MPLLNRKPALNNQYSSSDAQLENNFEKIDDDLIEADDDLLAGLDDMDMSHVESNEEIMAALDAIDVDEALAEPTPTPAVDEWLADVQELARKYGPFAPWQILEIIRALNAPVDGPVR